jgi:hypothetical protein
MAKKPTQRSYRLQVPSVEEGVPLDELHRGLGPRLLARNNLHPEGIRRRPGDVISVEATNDYLPLLIDDEYRGDHGDCWRPASAVAILPEKIQPPPLSREAGRQAGRQAGLPREKSAPLPRSLFHRVSWEEVFFLTTIHPQ